MKKKFSARLTIVAVLFMAAAISVGFLASQETRDFRIAKSG